MKKRALLLFIVFLGLLLPSGAYAVEDYSCLNFKVINNEGIWSLSEGTAVTKAVITWSIIDPGDCIIKGPRGFAKDAISWRGIGTEYGYWNGNWTSARSGDNYVIIFEFDIPSTWLKSLGNAPGVYDGWNGMMMDPIIGRARLWMYESIERKVSTSQSQSEGILAAITAGKLWGLNFSKRQGLVRDDCLPEKSSDLFFKVLATSSVMVLEAGSKPKIRVEISDPSNCIYMVYTPSINNAVREKLIENKYWDKKGQQFWDNLNSPNPSFIRVSGNVFGKAVPDYIDPSGFKIEKDALPIKTNDSVSLLDNKIVVISQLDLSGINVNLITPDSEAQIVIGTYFRYNRISSCASGGWTVYWASSTSYRISYRKGGCTPDGLTDSYQVISTKISLLDLLEKNGVANAKAKAAVDRAEAELKAKQEIDAKAAVDRAEAELKAKQEIDAKAAANKKTTITCVKGKLTKKVTALKPTCPSGYKVKA